MAMLSQSSGQGARVQTEIDDLRHDLLSTFLVFTLATSFVWYVYSAAAFSRLGAYDIPILLLPSATLLAYRLKERHYRRASWVVLGAQVLSIALILLSADTRYMLLICAICIVAANALLGTSAMLIVATALWAVELFVHMQHDASPPSTVIAVSKALPYYALCAAVWLSTRPLRISVHWSLEAWSTAREALAETQNRRAELYRAVRALEEATYRIERMNNELLVARHSAEEARALKARFLAMVSHEIRGPLNLVLGYTRLMVTSPETYGEVIPSAYRADLYTVYRSTQHLSELVNDVLDLSQVETQRLALVQDTVNVFDEVVLPVSRMIEPLAGRKGLYVRTTGGEALPPIFADATRLRQALLNLVVNAVRATERGGIGIDCAAQANELVITVEDTGPGISVDDMRGLFQEFHQVKRADGAAVEGSGLGLAICKHLVELHGGSISVESNVGVGTAFRVRLPLSGQGARQDLLLTDARVLPAIRPVCMVLHEDPTAVTRLAQHLEGYALVAVPPTADPVERAQDIHPQAIITTQAMAASVSRRLAEADMSVPVMYCDLDALSVETDGLGVIGLLVKPVDPAALRSIVKKLERPEETRVLIVDDEPESVRLLERLLSSVASSYTIRRAYNGKRALEILEDYRPDIMFLDIVMPEMTGPEVLAEMRASPATSSVPVVIVSSHSVDDGEFDLGIQLGMRMQESMSAAEGAACLSALMRTVHPHYLPDQVFD